MSRPVVVSLGGIEGEKAPAYRAALVEMGVPAERIRLLEPGHGEDYGALAAQAAGLVLAGGDDIEPARYGEVVIPEAGVETTPERDEMEFALLTGARAARTPVWAICRGLQMVNVFQGGTLYQDLTLQRPSAVAHSVTDTQETLAHGVAVTLPSHRLGTVLTGAGPGVNSRHHQGIKDLGADLLAVASAPDGLTEAIALDDSDWWVRAVQWHPENLTNFAAQATLWRDFLAAVEGRR